MRDTRLALAAAGVLLVAEVGRGGETREGPGAEAIEARVRPVLARCAGCHGGDEPAGELDLSTRESALRGGDSGAAVLPGDPAASPLYRKVVARKMPPKGKPPP
jgi:hypothetical protein